MSIFIHIMWVSRTFQTGKHVQTFKPATLQDCKPEGFRSVQTGRGGQRQGHSYREIDTAGFQFPSNGKAQRKSLQLGDVYKGQSVSIPFKRESTAKGQVSPVFKSHQSRVSIPFKRESTAKVEVAQDIIAGVYDVFQFPSNGKAQRKFKIVIPLMSDRTMFQFPSNGKAQRK